MLNLSKIKPRFWDHLDAAAGPSGRPFSFRRKWILIVLFTTVVTLTPLTVMTLMDYRLTRQAFESGSDRQYLPHGIWCHARHLFILIPTTNRA